MNNTAILLIIIAAAFPSGWSVASLWWTLRQRKGGRHDK